MLPSTSVTPEALAAAGFFFNPTNGSPDRCTCFACGLSLVQWEADDSPILEHVKHAPRCAFARTASKTLLNNPSVDAPTSSATPAPALASADAMPYTPASAPAQYVRHLFLAPLAAAGRGAWHCDDIDLDAV
eukprot:TRINITY_DN5130_c0_g1_i2.p1 TRINITY_DN5130_c0_g1~~TRINITY_DN5130_c0_g1_i2.p1  ORF type:complete len:132 (+),score=23.90 TRINITY_DN5130_c0_g1_i2:308-703(+)